jgi:hypothetical protein
MKLNKKLLLLVSLVNLVLIMVFNCIVGCGQLQVTKNSEGNENRLT